MLHKQQQRHNRRKMHAEPNRTEQRIHCVSVSKNNRLSLVNWFDYINAQHLFSILLSLSLSLSLSSALWLSSFKLEFREGHWQAKQTHRQRQRDLFEAACTVCGPHFTPWLYRRRWLALQTAPSLLLLLLQLWSIAAVVATFADHPPPPPPPLFDCQQINGKICLAQSSNWWERKWESDFFLCIRLEPSLVQSAASEVCASDRNSAVSDVLLWLETTFAFSFCCIVPMLRPLLLKGHRQFASVICAGCECVSECGCCNLIHGQLRYFHCK